MGFESGIEWTDHTFNPWQGCAKVSQGCANCYAEDWADRFGLDVWGSGRPRKISADSTWKKPRMWDKQAWSQYGRKARVFCASLADVFEDHSGVGEARKRLFSLIEETPNLIWQILTKRPENVNHMVPGDWLAGYWPRNIWLGTSVENQDVAAERCWHLLKTDAHVLFLSLEPLIGSVDLRALQNPYAFSALESGFYVSRKIDWMIVGGESGVNARPMRYGWVKSLREQAAVAGIPFFFKQWGRYIPPGQHSMADIAIKSDPASRVECRTIDIDGKAFPFFELGKNKTGNLLDGKTHQAFPDQPYTYTNEYA